MQIVTIARGRAVFDPTMSPEEHRRQHDEQRSRRAQRERTIDAQVAALVAGQKRLSTQARPTGGASRPLLQHVHGPSTAGSSWGRRQTPPDRTPAQQAIVDEELAWQRQQIAAGVPSTKVPTKTKTLPEAPTSAATLASQTYAARNRPGRVDRSARERYESSIVENGRGAA